jgi:hypothetical protein
MQFKLIFLAVVAAFALTATANPDSGDDPAAAFDDFEDGDFDDADLAARGVDHHIKPGINPISGLPAPKLRHKHGHHHKHHHKHHKGKHHHKHHHHKHHHHKHHKWCTDGHCGPNNLLPLPPNN